MFAPRCGRPAGTAGGRGRKSARAPRCGSGRPLRWPIWAAHESLRADSRTSGDALRIAPAAAFGRGTGRLFSSAENVFHGAAQRHSPGDGSCLPGARIVSGWVSCAAPPPATTCGDDLGLRSGSFLAGGRLSVLTASGSFELPWKFRDFSLRTRRGSRAVFRVPHVTIKSKNETCRPKTIGSFR